MELAVIDLETTGIAPGVDRIVEIAIVRTRGLAERERWSSLVHGEVPVGASERVHGITDAALREAPALSALAERIRALTAGATLVAHRAAFDLGFLRAAVERGELALEVPAHAIDTAPIAERVLGETGLAALARRIGGRAPTHRALPDALATLDVLGALVETLGPVEPSELVALSGTQASLRGEVEKVLRLALERREPASLLYRPASGRLAEHLVSVSEVEPPYVRAVTQPREITKLFRGDRIIRAWRGARPVLRFLDGAPPTTACVDVGGSRS